MSVFQSFLCMLRLNANAKMQVDFRNVKVAEAQKTLKDALITSDTVSKVQEETIKTLEKSVEDLKTSKAAVDKEILQEKEANIEAKKKISSLENQADTLNAKVKMLEDHLATERDTLAQKVAAAEDKFTDLAWYRMWVHNPDADLSFLEGELDKTVAMWKERLAEEEELMTYSEAAAKGDLGGEVSSKGLTKDQALLEAEIDALLGDDDMDEEQRAANTEAARQEVVQIVKETLAEANPSDQTQPPHP